MVGQPHNSSFVRFDVSSFATMSTEMLPVDKISELTSSVLSSPVVSWVASFESSWFSLGAVGAGCSAVSVTWSFVWGMLLTVSCLTVWGDDSDECDSPSATEVSFGSDWKIIVKSFIGYKLR